jgi:hypothetical protein
MTDLIEGVGCSENAEGLAAMNRRVLVRYALHRRRHNDSVLLLKVPGVQAATI